MLSHAEDSVLVLIDMQPSFLQPIFEGERVLRRCQFLLEIAAVLGIPVIATEQYPSRMGGTDERLAPLIDNPIGKMCFSCAGSSLFSERLSELKRREVALIGIETHICVNQTAHHLLEQGYKVFVCADAVGARTRDMHDIGLARMAAAGSVVAHSESIAYEWLGSADNPKFREALAVVKRHGEERNTTAAMATS